MFFPTSQVCGMLLSMGFGLPKHLMEIQSYFCVWKWLFRSGKALSRSGNTQNRIGEIPDPPASRPQKLIRLTRLAHPKPSFSYTKHTPAYVKCLEPSVQTNPSVRGACTGLWSDTGSWGRSLAPGRLAHPCLTRLTILTYSSALIWIYHHY